MIHDKSLISLECFYLNYRSNFQSTWTQEMATICWVHNSSMHKSNWERHTCTWTATSSPLISLPSLLVAVQYMGLALGTSWSHPENARSTFQAGTPRPAWVSQPTQLPRRPVLLSLQQLPPHRGAGPPQVPVCSAQLNSPSSACLGKGQACPSRERQRLKLLYLLYSGWFQKDVCCI